MQYINIILCTGHLYQTHILQCNGESIKTVCLNFPLAYGYCTYITNLSMALQPLWTLGAFSVS
jgi:hypothetical protein